MRTLSFANCSAPTAGPAAHATAPAPAGRPWVVAALGQLHRANPALAWAGWLHVVLLGLALGLLPLDHRLVAHTPVWIKPLKFALADGLFVWTLAWLLADLPAAAQRAVRRLSGGIAVSMVIETLVIFGQAARGQGSHFNTSSALNGLLFGVMGVFILLNTVLTVWALHLVWCYRPQGPAGYVWGVRLGMLLSLLGALVGGYMIRHLGHTVGTPDGGPGLPGLGWSTRAGDVRIAHFLGLHALQVLPLLGWALGRWAPRRATLLVVVGAILYATVVAALLAQALAGQPLWALR